MSNFFISQIFAMCSLMSTMLCTWQKSRKGILFFLLLDSIFLTISYFLLDAYTGAVTNIICIFRNIFFYLKENNGKVNNMCIPMSFIILHIIFGVISFNSFNSILPIIGSVIFCITAWQDNAKIVRLGTMLMVLMWLTYDITIKSYVSIVTETLSFLSALIAVIKVDILKEYVDKNNSNDKCIDKIRSKTLDKIEV